MSAQALQTPLPSAPRQQLERLKTEFEVKPQASAPNKRDGVDASLGRHALVALLSVAIVIGGLGVWAATTTISGAVVAGGVLVAEGGPQDVQHSEGGIVSEILVKNGDHVKAGQVIVRLDAKLIEASLAIIESQLRDAYSQFARLSAESSGSTTLTAPADAGVLADDLEFKLLMTSQNRLMTARAEVRQHQIDRLREQIVQLEEQATGTEAQLETTKQSLDLRQKEETDISALFDKGLAQKQRLNDIKRDRAALEAQVAQATASLAETRSSIAERKVQMSQVDADFLSQVMTDMQTVRQRIAEAEQQRIATRERLARLDIRAPVSGTVHESVLHTVGGVVGPGATMMRIVPDMDAITVDARLGAMDIDKIRIGQDVRLRMTALGPLTPIELDARVTGISPDLVRDPVSNQAYYEVRIAAVDGEAAKIPKDAVLTSGMPVEAFAQLGDRTVLAYMVQPFTEQLARVFIER